jgi:hypothetical protein
MRYAFLQATVQRGWLPVGWLGNNSFHWGEAISEVLANTGSTESRWCVAIIQHSHRRSSQYSYCRWMARTQYRSKTIASIIQQQNFERCTNKIPIDAEVALCGSHDDQEAQTLFPSSFCMSHIRSTAGVHPTKQRGNRVDHTVDSGNWPVWCWIRPPTGDQVSSTHGFHCWVD